MIFDTWGGALADGAYQEFSLAYMSEVVAQLQREHEGERVPCIVFTKGRWSVARADRRDRLRRGGAGLDSRTSAQARRRIDDRCALQGNLDPMALFAPDEQLRAQVRRVLDAFGSPRRS